MFSKIKTISYLVLILVVVTLLADQVTSIYATQTQAPQTQLSLAQLAANNSTSVPKPKPRPWTDKYVACKNGNEPECIDYCSTSYLIQDNKANIKVRSCVFENTGDPVRVALAEVAKNCLGSGDFSTVWRGYCASKKVNYSQLEYALLAEAKNINNIIACKQSLARLRNIVTRSRQLGDKLHEVVRKPDLSHAKTCLFKGAAVCIYLKEVDKEVCYSKSKVNMSRLNSVTSKAVTSVGGKVKPTGAPGAQGAKGADSSSGSGGGSAFSDSATGAYEKTFTKAMEGALQNILRGGTSAGGSAPSITTHKCDNYFYRIWHKKECSGQQDAVCMLLPSKTNVDKGEQILLKWEVKNAESYNLDIGLPVSNKQKISSFSTADSAKENLLITPVGSGYIKLSATGAGEDNECSQEVYIEVGSEGEDDSLAMLRCTPGVIPPNQVTSINAVWRCLDKEDELEFIGAMLKVKSGNSNIYNKRLEDQEGEITIDMNKSGIVDLACMYKSATTTATTTPTVQRDSCNIQQGEFVADIIAYPESVREGDQARISWVSIGASVCEIEGPDDFKYSYKAGSVVTTPFPEGSQHTSATYTLRCASQYGTGEFTKDVRVIRDY